MTKLLERLEEHWAGLTPEPQEPFKFVEVEKFDTHRIGDPPLTNRVRFTINLGREVVSDEKDIPDQVRKQIIYSMIDELYGEFRDDLISASIYAHEGLMEEAKTKIDGIYDKMFNI